MKLRLFLAFLLLVLPAVAPGQPREQFNNRRPMALDPAKSYIFYRTNERGSLVLLREIGHDEREALRVAAFNRAHADYEHRLAQWERSSARCARTRTSDCQDRPVEPLLATFPDPRPAVERFADIWWQPRFTQGDEGNSYLREVEPGAYIVYGNMLLGNNYRALGVCLCMGSLRFEARPGQIVDLGRITYRPPPHSRVPDSMTITPYTTDMSIPARLVGLPRSPAEFHAADKLPNYFGIEIDRHPALAGVLAYRRDIVIDARTGAPIAPGTH